MREMLNFSILNFLPPPPILNVGMHISPAKDSQASLRHRNTNIVLEQEEGPKQGATQAIQTELM